MIVIEDTNPTQLQRIKDIGGLEPLWASNNTLYNSNGEVAGKINRESGKIKIFTVT